MKHCLVVEDSRVIRKVACRLLESFAFATEEAEDANAALDLCRARMPDVILFDSQMPGANGVDFLRLLRREPNGMRPVVVVCTTENDPAQISEALAAGADEYIMKPFDREILQSKLTQIGLI